MSQMGTKEKQARLNRIREHIRIGRAHLEEARALAPSINRSLERARIAIERERQAAS